MEKQDRIRTIFNSGHSRRQSVFRWGFTLIELLIVIAIIGILVSVSVVSYSSAQKQGRDSRRRSDMKAMQNAWEQYYADNNGNYPSTCAIGAAYLPAGIPADPKSAALYTDAPGRSLCSAASYCFCAGLEAETNTQVDCAGGVASGENRGFFCVRNLQ